MSQIAIFPGSDNCEIYGYITLLTLIIKKKMSSTLRWESKNFHLIFLYVHKIFIFFLINSIIATGYLQIKRNCPLNTSGNNYYDTNIVCSD